MPARGEVTEITRQRQRMLTDSPRPRPRSGGRFGPRPPTARGRPNRAASSNSWPTTPSSPNAATKASTVRSRGPRARPRSMFDNARTLIPA
ncbi:hypothetical protein, partial [Streptomyces laculatispora]|uniref:hypothetical protein n=1 Tax=Streptomyces laculatispora TaxID=887464 RepID=UPI001F5E505C